MTANAAAPAIAIKDLRFSWNEDPLLAIDALAVQRGEKVFVQGASGSGKSTLLGLLGGVIAPASGRVDVLGQDLGALRQAERDHFRAEHIGFIFQQFNLLPYLSVLENVVLPCRFSRTRSARAAESGSVEASARGLLEALGVGGSLLSRTVGQLSIGQQQRVAAARALLGAPELLIADEPTSALDHDARGRFLDLLTAQCISAGTTLLFVSHDPGLAGRFDRSISMAEINTVPAHG
ncbi:MAG: ABC transporter ATP-binding protein [Pseudomonadota bacterium]